MGSKSKVVDTIFQLNFLINMTVCELNLILCEPQADDAEEEEVYTDSSAFLKVLWDIYKLW